MDFNQEIDKGHCVLTRDWGFVGYLKDGTAIPIGVYSCYADGAAHANAWMRNTSSADRWEGQRLYKETDE